MIINFLLTIYLLDFYCIVDSNSFIPKTINYNNNTVKHGVVNNKSIVYLKSMIKKVHAEKQKAALEEVSNFLSNIQKEVKRSQILIKNIGNDMDLLTTKYDIAKLTSNYDITQETWKDTDILTLEHDMPISTMNIMSNTTHKSDIRELTWNNDITKPTWRFNKAKSTSKDDITKLPWNYDRVKLTSKVNIGKLTWRNILKLTSKLPSGKSIKRDVIFNMPVTTKHFERYKAVPKKNYFVNELTAATKLFNFPQRIGKTNKLNHETELKNDTFWNNSETKQNETIKREYFSESLEKLYEQFVMKNFKDVTDLMTNFEAIYQKSKPRLSWIPEPVHELILTSIPLSHYDRALTIYIYNWIKTRKRHLSEEHKKIFELCNNLINKENGEHLLKVIEELRWYPADYKPVDVISKDLFDAFATPFEKMKGTPEMNSILYGLEDILTSHGRAGILRRQLQDESTVPEMDPLEDMDEFMGTLQDKLQESRAALRKVDFNELLQPISTYNNPVNTEPTISVSHSFDFDDDNGPYIPINEGNILKISEINSTLNTDYLNLQSVSVSHNFDYTPKEQDIPINEDNILMNSEIITTPNLDYLNLHSDQHSPTLTKLIPTIPSHGGYLSYAYELLLKYIALKVPNDVTEVLKHAEGIVDEMIYTNRLKWLGLTMTKVIKTTCRIFSTMPIEQLQDTVSGLHRLMRDRHLEYTASENNLIDYADSIIKKDEGDHLLEIIEEFKEFPKVPKTGVQMCEDIIAAFEQPYAMLEGTKELKDLIAATSITMKQEYPRLDRRRSRNKNMKYRSILELCNDFASRIEP